ncbi:type VII secretion target [Williamsia sp. M5A3_1d]
MDESLRIDVGGVVELADEMHRVTGSLTAAARVVDAPAFGARSVGAAYADHAEAYVVGMAALHGEIVAMRASTERLAHGSRTAASVLTDVDTGAGRRIGTAGPP